MLVTREEAHVLFVMNGGSPLVETLIVLHAIHTLFLRVTTATGLVTTSMEISLVNLRATLIVGFFCSYTDGKLQYGAEVTVALLPSILITSWVASSELCRYAAGQFVVVLF